jgi:valyl-tRNA synthetase
MAKVRLKGQEAPTVLTNLMLVAERALQLLHPFMPFVSEELYQALGLHQGSIVTSVWPHAEPDRSSGSASRTVAVVQEMIRAGRNLRSEVGLAPTQKASFVLMADDARATAPWRVLMAESQALLKAESLQVLVKGQDLEPSRALAGVTSGGSVYLLLQGLIDLDRERERVEKALDQARQDESRLKDRLNNPAFRARAPQEVVAQAEESLAECEKRIARLEQRRESLQ